MHSLSIFLSLVACASAYTITSPNSSQGWTNNGAQKVVWVMGGGDPSNFTLLLTNSATNYSQVLDALVQGSDNQVSANPPAEGWPTGPDFQVKFAASSEDIGTLLAQSDTFSIQVAQVNTSSSISSTSSSSFSTPTFTQPTAVTTSSPSVSPTQTSNSARVVEPSIMALVATFIALVL